MRQLGIPVSDDTILRHLKCNALQVDGQLSARIVGIDDWCWRKSWRYGTIVVDLERREVMDILEDRIVASVARWLKSTNRCSNPPKSLARRPFAISQLSRLRSFCSPVAQIVAGTGSRD